MQNTIILRLAQAFKNFDRELFLVGGCIRDELLGIENHDIDAATNALPDEIITIAKTTQPKHIDPIGEKFGTIRIEYENNIVIEVTTYRSESYQPGSRQPEVRFGQSLEADLFRRDFTINAIAKDPISQEIIDPCGGMNDLRLGFIRVVVDPNENPIKGANQRFIDDPLRLLRAARFVSKFSFLLTAETENAMKLQAVRIGSVSQERIADEISKILLSKHPRVGFDILLETGVLHFCLPEIEDLYGVTQPPHHEEDVYTHTMMVVEGVPARLEVRFSALLHDIGKPATKTMDERGAHFYGHEDVGATMAVELLQRLRFSNSFIKHIAKTVKGHMRINGYTERSSNATVRRLYVDYKETMNDLLDLGLSDASSDTGRSRDEVQERIEHLRSRIGNIHSLDLHTPIVSPLNGKELMAYFQLSQGAWIRIVKTTLFDAVIEGKLAPDDKAEAYKLAAAKIESLKEINNGIYCDA